MGFSSRVKPELPHAVDNAGIEDYFIINKYAKIRILTWDFCQSRGKDVEKGSCTGDCAADS